MATPQSHSRYKATRRAERARDFLVLTVAASALLGLLVATGALGIVEALTAIIVLCLGALAYFVGSAPPLRDTDYSVSEPARNDSLKASVRSLIHALPFPLILRTPRSWEPIHLSSIEEVRSIPRPRRKDGTSLLSHCIVRLCGG